MPAPPMFKPALETTLAEFQRTLDVNLTGAFLMTKACVPVMRGMAAARSSTSRRSQACVPRHLRVAYGTSKAALIHLTASRSRSSLWYMGIRANAIAPGPVETEMAKQVHSAAIRADYHDSIPLGRYGEEEFAGQSASYAHPRAAM